MKPPSPQEVSVVNHFLDIILDEFPGFLPEREVEFTIDVIPGLPLISLSPYNMVSVKLWELNKRYIRPNMSFGAHPCEYGKQK